MYKIGWAWGCNLTLPRAFMIMEYPVCVHVIDFHLRCQQNAQG
ncbi:hypothetical protein T02_16180 [Trichinella nativa]|uniref:Uncharacterized protein n=1 Tax=Trichinella nativa TaxID=6335 RepID=A0A0V1LTS8_9BILA|nr:hypothetical protein T02_16180 [Trichinella nativa]